MKDASPGSLEPARWLAGALSTTSVGSSVALFSRDVAQLHTAVGRATAFVLVAILFVSLGSLFLAFNPTVAPTWESLLPAERQLSERHGQLPDEIDRRLQRPDLRAETERIVAAVVDQVISERAVIAGQRVRRQLITMLGVVALLFLTAGALVTFGKATPSDCLVTTRFEVLVGQRPSHVALCASPATQPPIVRVVGTSPDPSKRVAAIKALFGPQCDVDRGRFALLARDGSTQVVLSDGSGGCAAGPYGLSVMDFIAMP